MLADPTTPDFQEARSPAPHAAVDAWRDGHLLVVPSHACIDDLCFTCGAPPTTAHPQRLYWHRPGWYLLLLLSPLVYFIVSTWVSRRAELIVGLCARHSAARLTQRHLGWLLVGLAAALLKVGAVLDAPLLMLLSPLALLAGVILLRRAGRIVRVASIDDDTARISNGSPRLRAGLPDLATRTW